MTRSRDVADTQDNLGGAVAPYVGGKNGVINGAFDIWQRGTNITNAGNGQYNADRWQGFRGAGTTGLTISRQVTGDSTNLPFIQYCARVQRDAGNTSTQFSTITQPFETINTIPFAGKTLTISYYARRGADFSATSNVLTLNVFTGTGIDQTYIAGYTGFAQALSSSVVLTTNWQRFSATFTLASTVTEMSSGFACTNTGTAGANDYFEVTGVQLEIGAVATPFARAGGSIGGELALCQRYYQSIPLLGNLSEAGFGQFVSSTIYDFRFPLTVTMRTVNLVFGAGINIWDTTASTPYSGGVVTLAASNANGPVIRYTHGSAVFTTGRMGYYFGNGGYLAVSGEL